MITKKYLKTKPVVKVTFSLTKTQHHNAKKVTIAGDFNDWNTTETPLKKNKDGKFSVSLDLEKGRSYQFRYLLNGETWGKRLES